jgi:hypothetical protein
MANITSEKECSECKITKDISDFYKKGNRFDTTCKSCIKSKRKTKYVSTQKLGDFNRISSFVELIYECEKADLIKLENEIDLLLVSASNRNAA